MAGMTSAIMLGVSLAMTAAGTYANIQQANAQREAAKSQAEYQAAVAQKNQELAEEQARQQRIAGYEEATRTRRETAILIGRQRAAQGASGSVVDAGGNLDLNLDTVERGEFDALAAYQKGLNASYNSQIQAWNYGQQSAGYQMQADNADKGSGWATVGAIAGGVAAGANSAFNIGSKSDWWGLGNSKTAKIYDTDSMGVKSGKQLFNSTLAGLY